MDIDDSKLGVGSIVRTGEGFLYSKDVYGTWWKLRPLSGSSPFQFDDLGSDVEILYQNNVSPLERIPVGSAISFDEGCVAVRYRKDFWAIPGLYAEFTFEELEDRIEDKSTIKRLVEEN